MDYTIPETMLDALQGILVELVLVRDPAANFVTPDEPVAVPPGSAELGKATE